MPVCSNLTCGHDLFLIGADELCEECAKLTGFAFTEAAALETLGGASLSLLENIRRKAGRLRSSFGGIGLFPEVRVSFGLNGALTIAIGMEIRRRASLAPPPLLGPFTIIRGPDIAGQLLRILALLETPDIAVYPMHLGGTTDLDALGRVHAADADAAAARRRSPPPTPGWAGSEDFGGSDF